MTPDTRHDSWMLWVALAVCIAVFVLAVWRQGIDSSVTWFLTIGVALLVLGFLYFFQWPKVAPFLWGTMATAFLLAFYYGVVSLVSGQRFAELQFHEFWYYVVSLAIGFGIQAGLSVHIRQTAANAASTGVVAVSGTTSAVSMVACCAHHLVDVLPLLGVTGVLSFLGQYQRQFFWVALAFNGLGIAYLARTVRQLYVSRGYATGKFFAREHYFHL